ncbi:hypothetical protein AWM75_04145 [Aerococcus urinaehominis]|uniref:Uncharacterized protein n=1 Tax=Aerococcus urinaehominis TaxID=128944 RepID=A0A109RGZ7_9LACT|nr:hypothetical protein [Aerococcus urinaehominis]AMB99246.1 hypothetical protein AWM75_04145 [Aerococcus urinaehominis]SDM31187.1 hypothetical protein SAMN04487985_1128 [Aerococcus urinaehominis]
MKKSTKLAILALSGVAAVAAVAAVAIYEENENHTMSKLRDELGRYGRQGRREIAQYVDQLPVGPNMSTSDKWRNHAEEVYDFIESKFL